MEKILNDKLNVLINDLKKMKKVAIAYSGGVDSNFLLKVAKDTLGENVVAITINAMMHSNREIQEALSYGKEYGVNHILYKVDNIDLEGFIENGPLRCYHCKKFIFNKIKEKEHQYGFCNIMESYFEPA